MRSVFLALVVAMIALSLVACEEKEEEAATPTPRPTASATATPRATPTPKGTPTRQPTRTPEPTPTPEVTPTAATTPVPEATPTVEPTPEETEAPPVPAATPEAPPVTTQSFEGFGQEASPPFELDKGLTIFRMTHSGNSNFAITLLDDQGEWVDLLVNEIGSFDGSKALGIEKAGTHVLDITADGAWAVVVEQIEPTAAAAAPQSFSGVGQHASPLFQLKKGLVTFRMTHDGSSNFAIVLLDSRGDWVDVLVNEIGPFDGSKATQAPAGGIYILDITADGNWSVAIEQ